MANFHMYRMKPFRRSSKTFVEDLEVERERERGKMDSVFKLQRALVEFRTSLLEEEFLDDQFSRLEQLQEEDNPSFVFEVVSIFYEDFNRILNGLAKDLEEEIIDYRKVDGHVNQLKGSSSTIGALRLQRSCIAFRNYSDVYNLEGCVKSLIVIRNEFALMKDKFRTLVKEIALQVSARTSPVVKNPNQCKNKIESMKKKYRLESAATASKNSNMPSSWQFYARMDQLLKGTLSLHSKVEDLDGFPNNAMEADLIKKLSSHLSFIVAYICVSTRAMTNIQDLIYEAHPEEILNNGE
ncbi:hypothetical protein LguiB_010680 [Lonicera macranthoides]